MPTYEYRCQSCGHRLDAFQSINDAALRECPACGQALLERIISGGAGVVFKGSGFYQTDYKSSGKASGEDSKSGGTGDSKPAGGCGSGCACC
jgi:putative FmdB family regulatory protein